MTKVIDISIAQSQLSGLLAAARENGDEIIIEENGEEIGKITPTAKRKSGEKLVAGLGQEDVGTERKQRVLGLGRGTVWMSEDFNDELPDEFWGFDEEL